MQGPAIVLMLISLLPAAAWAGSGRGYIDVSGGYKTGSFGTPIRTNFVYLATGVGYVTPVYDVSVTAGYAWLGSSGGQSGTMNRTSGISDVIVRGGRVLVAEGGKGFSLDGALAVKLATADETKGLGTGETDYGVFLNAHQRFAGVKLSLLTGYIKTGEPANIAFNDVYLYGVGISKVFGFTDLYASFEGRRAMVPGAENPREIHAGFFHALNSDYAVKASTFFGMNNGGPDFGFDAGVVRWF
jgi:hypothetical protein